MTERQDRKEGGAVQEWKKREKTKEREATVQGCPGAKLKIPNFIF